MGLHLHAPSQHSLRNIWSRCPCIKDLPKYNTIFYKTNVFLSDPSPIIGYACHSLPNSLTHCRLVSLIDVTLACEDANSKLVEVLTVAHVDAEDHVGNSLLQILKLRFGHEVKFCSDFEHRVGQDFEVEVQATF